MADMRDLSGPNTDSQNTSGTVGTYDAMAEVEAPQDENEKKVIPRELPNPEQTRANLVDHWQFNLTQAKQHWKRTFEDMREDQRFARGVQWSEDPLDPRYVANVTYRHIQQRTATLYAKNPTTVAKRRERLLNTVWDGKQSSLQAAQATMQMISQQMAMAASQGLDPGSAQLPMQAAMTQGAQAAQIIADADKVRRSNEQNDKMAKTLELLYDYNIDEQVHPFKAMMKLSVRRAITTGVSFVKVGFQRAMEKIPEVEARVSDFSERLATLERMTADIADGEHDEGAKEREIVRLQLESMREEQDIIVKEGLIFDYPDPTAIIIDPRCMQLREFVGADWVAQEFMMSSDQIKETYNIDVGLFATPYQRGRNDIENAYEVTRRAGEREGDRELSRDEFCVWEVYSRKDGLVYHVCDGYPEFLREPAAPVCKLERFYPWFPLVLNEIPDTRHIYPISDVRLMQHQQMEINRMKEALREHRIGSRPGMVAAPGRLDDADKEKLQNRGDMTIIELNAMSAGEDVKSLLQPLGSPGVDPGMYETQTTYDDIMRVMGTSEASMGAAGGGVTATEVSQAEGARKTALASNIDDVDDQLTAIARASGQILFQHVSAEMVTKIVGEGAVWPDMTSEEAAAEIYLEIEAGSAGRPNQMAEIQNFERIAPILTQIPGIQPEFLAKEAITRLDDNVDMQQAFVDGLPSIVAMNSMKAAAMAGGGAPGGGQPNGPQGAANGETQQRDSKADGPPPGGVPQGPPQ